jgi:hypothetical protein
MLENVMRITRENKYMTIKLTCTHEQLNAADISQPKY